MFREEPVRPASVLKDSSLDAGVSKKKKKKKSYGHALKTNEKKTKKKSQTTLYKSGEWRSENTRPHTGCTA